MFPLGEKVKDEWRSLQGGGGGEGGARRKTSLVHRREREGRASLQRRCEVTETGSLRKLLWLLQRLGKCRSKIHWGSFDSPPSRAE